MPYVPLRRAVFALPIALAALSLDSVVAQVPDGSAIFGTAVGPASSGTCGLFTVPLTGGSVTAITGLPPELAVASGGGYVQGAGSVAYRATDGAIVVGTQGDAAGPHAGAIHLFVLHLNGSAVSQTQQVLLGNTSSRGNAFAVPLPDGRVLVAVRQGTSPVPTGPMAGSTFAIVDLSGPTISLLPNPNISAAPIGGLAVDPTGRYAYFTHGNGELFQWDTVNNAACMIASWPGEVAFSLACDNDGLVYVGTDDMNAITHSIQTVQPNGCGAATVTSTVSSTPIIPVGMAFDRAAGRMVVPSGPFGPGFPSSNFNSLWLIDPVTGVSSLVASPWAGGWGAMGRSAVAVNNATESYGGPSGGAEQYWFENFPNPGGQPTLGNSTFSLTVRASMPPTLSSLAVSLGMGSLVVAGVEVLVDPGSAATAILLAAQSNAYTISIPNNPSFSGLTLAAQSFHLENNSIAASAGLLFTIQ